MVNFWRFEAKTETYISYEDINTQFVHSQGQNVQSHRKQKAAYEIGHLGSQGYFSHFISYSAPIELKFCRKLVNTTFYNFHVLT